MTEPEPPDLPWDAEPLTGRSLTMDEYLNAVLRWVDSHFVPRRLMGEDLEDEHERLESLRDAIRSAEQLRMLKRVGAGEDWSEIKASTRGGRLA